MKEFLSRDGRAFTAKDVDEDDSAYRELVAMGIMSVPLTVIGEARIKGFNPKALADALSALDRS